MMSPEQFPSFEVSKRWTFVVSHNYNETTQDPKSPEFFLSLFNHTDPLIFSNMCYSDRCMVREVEFLHFVLFSFKSLFRKITRTILIHSLPFLFFLMGKFVNEGSGVEILIPINSEM